MSEDDNSFDFGDDDEDYGNSNSMSHSQAINLSQNRPGLHNQSQIGKGADLWQIPGSEFSTQKTTAGIITKPKLAPNPSQTGLMSKSRTLNLGKAEQQPKLKTGNTIKFSDNNKNEQSGGINILNKNKSLKLQGPTYDQENPNSPPKKMSQEGFDPSLNLKKGSTKLGAIKLQKEKLTVKKKDSDESDDGETGLHIDKPRGEPITQKNPKNLSDDEINFSSDDDDWGNGNNGNSPAPYQKNGKASKQGIKLATTNTKGAKDLPDSDPEELVNNSSDDEPLAPKISESKPQTKPPPGSPSDFDDADAVEAVRLKNIELKAKEVEIEKQRLELENEKKKNEEAWAKKENLQKQKDLEIKEKEESFKKQVIQDELAKEKQQELLLQQQANLPRNDDLDADKEPQDLEENELPEDDEEYEIDPAVLADLDLSDPKRWCEMPAPKGKMIQCKIERDKTSVGKKFLPVYHVYLDSDNTYLMSAKKRGMNVSSNYLISCNRNDLDVKSPWCVGKLRSNFLGTEFHCYSQGKNPSDTKKVDLWRKEYATVQYEKNVFGMKGPRKMTVYIPGLNNNGDLIEIKPANSDDSVYNRWKIDPQSIPKLINKPPKWSEEYQAFVLNFYGRVRLASVKNFQLIDEGRENYVFLQFGKVNEHEFTMDFQWPMTPAQAFMICISSFDFKWACE